MTESSNNHHYHQGPFKMLQSDESLRFTPTEIEYFRALGIDLSGVRSPDDFAATLEPWFHALGEVRPDLFDKIVQEIAAAKGGSATAQAERRPPMSTGNDTHETSMPNPHPLHPLLKSCFLAYHCI
jgi:hypothetical protein